MTSPFEAALVTASPLLRERVDGVLDVFRQCFERWAPHELALSFNGGKDCTVLLHLLFHYCAVHQHLCPGADRAIRVVFFDTDTGFPEVTEFMVAMEARYGFKIESLPGLKPGMASLVADGVHAVLLGTRRTDPHGGASLTPHGCLP